MNVIAKSTNLSPYLKATVTAVSNGGQPVGRFSKAQKSKISMPIPVNRVLGYTIGQALLSRPVRVSSGISVSTHVHQVRQAHTDIPIPDFTTYRKSQVKDPTSNNRDTLASRRSFTYILSTGAMIGTLYTTKTVIIDLVSTLGATADVLALAKIEIKLDKIPEGKSAIFKWRGKPIFVRHRDAAEIEKERAVDLSTLRDVEHDSDRVQKPEWLVVVGVCTHLGCVPIANSGDYHGYYCPCHGSHYDASGRIRKGPAPLNLEVPPYSFEDDVLVVG